MERIFLLHQKMRQKGFFQNINFQYASRAENRIITTEDDLFGPKMFDNAKTGMSHNIPINKFKVFKFFSVSTGMSLKKLDSKYN